jgi:hypothetical protein
MTIVEDAGKRSSLALAAMGQLALLPLRIGQNGIPLFPPALHSLVDGLAICFEEFGVEYFRF